MKDNNHNKKQSRREKTDTIVLNPDKSADPPQPQGKSNNALEEKEKKNIDN